MTPQELQEDSLKFYHRNGDLCKEISKCKKDFHEMKGSKVIEFEGGIYGSKGTNY